MTTTLAPTRRGERRAARVTRPRPTARCGLAARQRRLTCRARCRCCPPFASRRFLPEKLSRLRADRRRGAGAPARAGQRVRLAAHLRHGRRRPRHRLAGHGPLARSRGAHLAARARPARRARRRHRPRVRGPGRRRAAPGRRARRLPAARRGGRARGRPGGARRGRRRGAGPARPDRRPATCCRAWSAHSPRSSRRWSRPTRSCWPPRCCGRCRKRSLVVLFSALDTAADTGLLPAARALAARHEVVVASASRPGAGAALARARDDPTRSTWPRRPSWPRGPARVVVGAAGARSASTSSTPRPTCSPRKVADAYLDLKAAGRL